MENWSIDNYMYINSTQTDLQPLCNVYLIWILLVLTRLSSVLFSTRVILAHYPISNWINCCFMHVTCTSHLSSSVSTVFPKLIYFNTWNFTLICNVWMLYSIHSSWPFKMVSCMLLFELGLNATFSISYSEVHGSGWVIYYPNNMLDIIHSVRRVQCTQNFGRWLCLHLHVTDIILIDLLLLV